MKTSMFTAKFRPSVSRPLTTAVWMWLANGLLKKIGNATKSIAVAGALGLAALLPSQSKAVPEEWSSITDIIAQAPEGESINYTSSNSTILPNRLSGIYFLVVDGYHAPIGGFDMQNGVVTQGYFNEDWNSVNAYGLTTGDIANTEENASNTYFGYWQVFRDNDLNSQFTGYSEQLSDSEYSISNFTPYGSANPGNFTFTLLTGGGQVSINIATLDVFSTGGGSNRISMLVAVTNAVSFGVEYKNALGAATWTPLGTYATTGTVTVVADTNAVPVRFYRAIAP